MSDYYGESGARRFWAHVIDNIIAFGSTLAVMGAVGVATSQPAVAIALGLGAYIAYFIVCEALWSRTPGKMMLGLIVVTTDGYTIGWREASLRTIMRLVEVNPFLFGNLPAGLAVLFSNRKQRFGDMAADTVVVRYCGEVEPGDDYDPDDEELRAARFGDSAR